MRLCDDLGLDFGGTFKDVQDAGVAEDAADFKFQGEAIAAVNLQGVVGGGPGDAGAQELCHARFQITAAARILFARRGVAELAGRHDFGGHEGELVGHARELDDGLAELLAVTGVFQAEIEGILRHADGAGGGLDAGAFKGLHQLLEALALNPAQKIFGLHFKILEADFKFLHAAVAQDFDFAAAHALCRKRVRIIAPRLFGEEHGKPLVALFLRNAPYKEGHQVGAHRMGDPGLVAGHLVDIAGFHGAGFEGAQVGARIGFGEDGGGENFAAGDFGQPFCFLLFGAAAENEFTGDFGPGAERTHGNPAARQFLGDHAHGFLGQAKAAKVFRKGEGENPEFRQFLDDLQRHVGIFQMPLVGMGGDLAGDKALHGSCACR